MKTKEKIYSGIFVVAIIGSTVLLNSPSIRNRNNSNQLVVQQEAEYNSIEIKEEVKLVVKDEENE